MRLPGACHVHFVRSAVAHARIRSVDVSAALEAPGVIAAFTGADLADLPTAPPPMPGMINAQMRQPLLAPDAVRYVGEPVAVVVTEDRYQGEDAADLVDVDYDDAAAGGRHGRGGRPAAAVLFPAAGSNVAATFGDAGRPGGRPVRRLRGRRLPHHRQPAGRARPDGDPGRGRGLGRGRQADGVDPEPGRAGHARAPWRACSGSTRPRSGSSPRTWAARSAPSSAPTRSTRWSAGWPGGSAGPRAGPRPATRT